MIVWLLFGCGTPQPPIVKPAPYKRPARIDHAASHREAMIPALIATGVVTRLGPPPGIGWADVEWRAFRQEVEIDIQQRVYDPRNAPNPLVTSVLVLPDMPFSCSPPCTGAIRPDIVGRRVLIEASHHYGDHFKVNAGAESFVIDPTAEDIAKALEFVPLDRR